MIKTVKRKLIFITVIYWILLLYMIAALLWWFIALNNQNKILTATNLSKLKQDDILYSQKADKILELKQRKTAQYIGEGVTFLVLILIGAVYVYRATRKQILFSAQQNNFMMAVTHELKTPIAITVLNLETLQKRKLEEEKQQKIITSTLQETHRLNTLCNNILLSAQLDGGAYFSNKQEINLSEIVETTAKEFSLRFQHYTVETKVQPDVFIEGEQMLLQMLINNLIENAIKYSPKNTTIALALEQVQQKILLSVADEGFGIADDEKKKVFNKFYRTGNENTRTTKGTGLGLYLCSQICKSHNGKISIIDNKPQGSIFKVEFINKA